MKLCVDCKWFRSNVPHSSFSGQAFPPTCGHKSKQDPVRGFYLTTCSSERSDTRGIDGFVNSCGVIARNFEPKVPEGSDGSQS